MKIAESENKGLYATILVLALLLSLILIILSYATLSNRESALFGTVLTFVSILAGGLITHSYAQKSNKKAIEELADFHQRNLRTYALKAAEKVNNLSKELTRLSSYLESDLEETEYRSVEEELLAKKERFESVIHMLITLKSVNDTSLSDWQGVIGEEIYEQRVEEAKRTEELNEILERFSVLESAYSNAQKFDPAILQHSLNEVKRDLRSLASEVVGAPIKRFTDKKFSLVNQKCPSCSNVISYRQKEKESQPKALTCNICQTNLISEYSEAKGFKIHLRKSLSEDISCPSCEQFLNIELDEWPTASTTVNCINCDEAIRISRSTNGLKTNLIQQQKSKYPLTPEIIEAIRDAMPGQPWPRGIHKTVAETVNLPHQQVQRAIQHLIRMGIFLDQVDGQVCTTKEKLMLMRSAGENL